MSYENKRNDIAHKKRVVLLILEASILIVIAIIAAVYIFSSQKSPNIPTAEKQTKQEKPLSNDQSVLLSKIASRVHIKDQKNIGSGKIASGFLHPSAVKKKATTLLHTMVYAAEDQLVRPFLFYVKDTIKINAYDLITKEEYETLDLDAHPEVITNGRTQIYDMVFLNRRKEIIFMLVEQTTNASEPAKGVERYRVSLKLYDIAANTLSDIVSVNDIRGGELPNFDNNLKVSPDEKMVFWMYDNQSGYNPFPEIPDPSGESGHPVVLFYNTETEDLSKFKLLTRLSGVGLAKEQWLDDSNSVVIAYRTVDGPNRILTVLQVFPEGTAYTLVHENAQIEAIEKIQYIAGLEKFYLTGSADIVTTNSKVYEFDFFSKQLIPVIPGDNAHTLDIVYDHQEGILYDTFENVRYSSNTGGIANRALNHYNINTKESRVITTDSLKIIGFNGDYDHILVSGYIDGVDNKYSNIYDLNIKTGEIEFINTAPISWSVFPD